MMLHRGRFALQEILDSSTEVLVRNPVCRARLRRQETSPYLVFTLCARFEYFQLSVDTVLDAGVIADLEMQAVVIITAAPVASIKFILAFETDSGSDGAVFMVGENRSQPVSDGSKEFQC